MAIESPEHAPSKEYVQSKLFDADGFWYFVDPHGSQVDHRAFVRSFTQLPETMSEQSQQRLTTDQALQKRFSTTARVRGDIDLYTKDETYHLLYGNQGHTDISLTAHLDAPCAYTLDYQRTDGKKEIISVVSFLPSFKDRTLYIDQIQGGAGFKHQSSQEARRIRFKLADPELVLVMQVIALARMQGFARVAIRKTEANKYQKVATKARNGTKSLYDKTIHALRLEKHSETQEHVVFTLDNEE